VETTAKRCIFELKEEAEDIFLVARLLSIGDELKEKGKEKEKEKEKDKKKSSDSLPAVEIGSILPLTPPLAPSTPDLLTYTSLDAITMLRYPFAWGGVRLFKPGQKGYPVQIPLTALTKGTMDEESLVELLLQGEKVLRIILSVCFFVLLHF